MGANSRRNGVAAVATLRDVTADGLRILMRESWDKASPVRSVIQFAFVVYSKHHLVLLKLLFVEGEYKFQRDRC